MLIINDYSKFCFTKIEAVIFLDKCPSDVKENEYWLDIDVASYSGDSCFVGKQKVEHIQVCKNHNKDSSAKWNLMMVIEKPLCETEEPEPGDQGRLRHRRRAPTIRVQRRLFRLHSGRDALGEPRRS